MSDHVHIRTPMPIQAGNQEYRLLTFEDLYERCIADKDFFARMLAARERLGLFLEDEKLALPKKCFEMLVKLLNDKKAVKALQEYIAKKLAWPGKGMLFWGDEKSMRGLPCTWPNCPSD